jgi:membrane-associated phospholipid phosphatase
MQMQRMVERSQYWLYFFGALAVFLGVATVVYDHPYSSFETAVFRGINNMPPAWWPAMLAITQAGGIAAILALAVVAAIARRVRLVLAIIGLSVFTQAWVVLAKTTIGRARPEHLLDAVHTYGPTEVGLGFPSGHTATATVLGLVAANFLPGKWKWLVAAWICLVGISRMYLGVHGPLDVVGGVCLGVIVYCLARLIAGKWWKTLMN